MKNENKQTYYNQCELKYKINEKYNQMQILQIKENNRIEEVNEIKDVKLLFIKPYCVPPEKANPRIKKPAVFFNIFLIDKNNKRIVVTTYRELPSNELESFLLHSWMSRRLSIGGHSADRASSTGFSLDSSCPTAR